MSEPKVSIIMPVYGVEEYVGKAIESILSQTYQNWEFFCVDDGTKDKSGIICDEYAEKDSRIIVIHKENGGAPSARNVAIEKATGKYMYFMDSDDWAEPTMLSDMVKIAECQNAQLVVAGFYIDTYYNETEKYVQEQYVKSVTYATQQEFRGRAIDLFDKNLLYTPWNKLFLSEYIFENNLRFPKTMMDDFPFVLSVIRDVERVSVTSKMYYHFIRKRAESETQKYRPNIYEKRVEEHKWMCDLYDHWSVSNDDVDEFLARRYIERLIECIENVTNYHCTLSFFEKLKKIREMITNDFAVKSVRLSKSRSFYMRLMLVPIKMKSTLLVFLEGKVISLVKTRNTRVFATLKANR